MTDEIVNSSVAEAKKLAEKRLAENQGIIIKLMLENESFVDEDGYPTDAALEIVRRWNWTDPEGWFRFIKNIWSYTDWGWHESEVKHEFTEGKMVFRYNLSTAGWSGNESLIRAMQDNDFLWWMVWTQSRKGGHYIFEFPKE